MAATIEQPVSASFSESKNIVTTFLTWSKEQEPHRILWVGVALATHGCIITPLTIMALLMLSTGDVPMISFTMVMLSMVMVLVTNLAALPTKITIPVYVLSFITDMVILAAFFA